MIRPVAALLLLPICIGSYAGEEPRPILGYTGDVTATPIAFDPSAPRRRRAGALRFLGGWRLTSSDPAFGSFSALVVVGERFTLVNDAGGAVQFDFRNGRPSRIRFGDLPGPGRGVLKEDRDAEAMTIDPATGRVWIAYENWNGIWRYPRNLATVAAASTPLAMHGWPSNGGPEAMVRLRSGRFLVFSERGDGPGGSTAALLFAGDPTDARQTPTLFGYRAPSGYRVTDAAELPDGRLVLLHRRLHLPYRFSAKLTLIDPRTIRRGGIILGREIATLAAPMSVDNEEGIAITQENGRTILWIVSDDNFSILQKTLLLKFSLAELPAR